MPSTGSQARWRPTRRRLRAFIGTLSTVALLQLASRSIPPVSALFGIAEQRFKYEGFIDLGALGLDEVDGMVAAVGDLTGDQLLYLFMLSSDQRSISFYEWNRAAYTFQPVGNASAVQAPFVVTNIVPGDFDYDGRLDMLLMGEDNPGGWWSESELKMAFRRGVGQGQFAQAVNIPSSQLEQPIPLDAQGDMQVDLLGFPFGDAQKQNLKMWRNSWQESNATAIFELADPSLDIANFNCQFPNPHSNAFIDLDGDCLADLFLVCQDSQDSSRLTYQIWINSKSAGFKLSQTGSLPPGAGQISFADMDRDGTIDMVFPTCTSQGCAINIAYNQQMPLCTATSGFSLSNTPETRRCRDAENLCVADPDFSFNLSQELTNSAFQQIPLSTIVPDAPYLVLADSAFRGNLPNPLRIGDYNKDGYPDLLILSSGSSGRSQGRPSLLQSQPCSKKTCTQAAYESSRRSFAKLEGDAANALNSIQDAKSAMWMDIDEDGSLDILVQRSKGSGVSRRITFIKNNYFHDAFFLKTLFGNGACEGTCFTADGQRYHPYGVSYSGASYKFTVLDTSGIRRATQVGQLPQTSYLSLQTPYSYFGLGRTNNYVENLFVGSTRHQEQHFMYIEGLIPNSQVVIVPYQPDEVTSPATWSRQLFLQPGKWIPWVAVTLVGSLLILSAITLGLHLNEKREDEQERKRAVHRVNFNAM